MFCWEPRTPEQIVVQDVSVSPGTKPAVSYNPTCEKLNLYSTTVVRDTTSDVGGGEAARVPFSVKHSHSSAVVGPRGGLKH